MRMRKIKMISTVLKITHIKKEKNNFFDIVNVQLNPFEIE